MRTKLRSVPTVAAALAALAALTLTACGSGGSKTTPSETVSLAAGSSSASVSTAGVTLNVLDQTNHALQLPLTATGGLTGADYKVTWASLASGPAVAAAFNAGQADVGWLGDTSTLQAIAGQGDITAIAAQKFPDDHFHTIVAGARSGITSVADLRGKRVAYFKGSSLEGYLLEVLKGAGLKWTDIKPIAVPVAALATVLNSGDADAVVMGGGVGGASSAYTYVTANPGTQILTPATNPTYMVLLASKSALKDPAKRAAIQDLAVRVIKENSWRKANQAEYTQNVLVTGDKETPVQAAKAYELTRDADWGVPTQSFIDYLTDQANQFTSVGELPADLTVAAILDKSWDTDLTAALKKAGVVS